MIKPYHTYKKSNIEWIGKIPENWDTVRLKNIISYQKGKIPSMLYEEKLNDAFIPYLGMDYLRGNKNSIQYVDINANDALISKEGDVLLLWDGSNAGEFIKGKDGTVCSTMALIKTKKNTDNRFFLYLSNIIEHPLRKQTTGMGIPHVNSDVLNNIICPLPPFSEQRQIACYLDHKAHQIDTLIEKKQKLIELLKEQRNAIINQTVTKGLDPEVSMKDSGIEWLGEIPKHWDLRKISRSFNLIGSGTTPKSDNYDYYENGKIRWVITGDLNDGTLADSSKKITEKALSDYSALKVYPKGTLLIAMYGATIGKISLMNFEGCTNQACCALSNSPYLTNKFTFYWFLSNRQNIVSMSFGGGQPNISQDVIRGLKISTPPITEQKQIADYLDHKTCQIDTFIEKKQKLIDMLKEYRTALISNAVTGKIDVREEALT